MPNLKQICLGFVLICALCSTAAAQESSSSNQRSTLTITANATGERVRITAPSSVVQLHLEVYAANGEKLFDQEIRGGNVFDWHLQDGQAQRLAPGVYVCVVTAKSVSGRLTQKLGAVTVAEKSAGVQAGSPQLSLQQTQAIGPVEADSSWTIAGENEPQTPTVIASDGKEGQMIRGRGALTFRLGNFFSGIDTEQMRLTEEGNLGIGTAAPQAKLDVAGAIRAERFLVVKPGKTGSQAQSDDSAQANSDSVQPLVAGTGTQNRLAKWTDNAGTLGDSGITETAGGNIGIGTASPGVALDVVTSGASTDLKVRESSRTVGLSSNWTGGISGVGTLTNNKFGIAANGGIGLLLDTSGNVGIGTTSPAVALDVVTAGAATDLQVREASRTVDISSNWTAGISGIGTTTNNKFGLAANKSIGLTLDTTGNVGIGTTTPAEKLTVRTAKGFYGFTHLATDANGANPIELSTYVGGSTSGATGGWLGTKTNHDLHFFTNGGQPSLTIIASGNVGIGTSTPTNKLHVENTGSGSVAVYGNVTNSGTGVWGNNTNNGTGVYGTSGNGIGILGESNGVGVRGKSDSGYAGYFEGKVYVGGSLEVFGNICAANFMCQSDARLKQAVAELHYGLSEVLRLRPVRWDWKDQAQRQPNLGLIAQEVEEVLPELVTTANDAEHTKGLIYIGLLPVVIKAIQEQQAALEQKETTLKSLKAESAALQQRNTELDARLTAVEQALQQLLNQQAQAQPGKRRQ